MEPPAEPPAKKPLSNKKIEALKKARVALVKTRDENRLSLHENALNDVIERKLEAKLTALKEQMPKREPEPVTETEQEVVVVKKKPSTKPVRIVEISDSESSDSPIYVHTTTKSKSVPKPVRAPPRRKPAPKPDVQYTEETPQQTYRNVNADLFNSIFGR
jgi:hypothetical protein